MSDEMLCSQREQIPESNQSPKEAEAYSRWTMTARLQDELTGALIGLARAADNCIPPEEANHLILEGLSATLANGDFDHASLKKLIERAHQLKHILSPLCSTCTSQCSKNADYDLEQLRTENQEIRSLKSLLLLGMRAMAAYAYQAMVLGYEEERVYSYLYKGLFAVGYEGYATEDLVSLATELGAVSLECMALLDRAGTVNSGRTFPASVHGTVQ